MRLAKNDVPVKFSAPGAVARQQVDFGDATGFGKMGGEYFSLGAGADLAPLLLGLEGDLCQCPHWGYVLQGAITTTYTSGEMETAKEGDLFYWPPGHTVKADEDTEMILFSPQHEHNKVMSHIMEKMGD
jgi:hypothetical protein